eukprot:5204158-Prymnesium_polylepis.1
MRTGQAGAGRRAAGCGQEGCGQDRQGQGGVRCCGGVRSVGGVRSWPATCSSARGGPRSTEAASSSWSSYHVTSALRMPSAVARSWRCAVRPSVGMVCGASKSKSKSLAGAERRVGRCLPYMSVAWRCSMSMKTESLERKALKARRSKPVDAGRGREKGRDPGASRRIQQRRGREVRERGIRRLMVALRMVARRALKDAH